MRGVLQYESFLAHHGLRAHEVFGDAMAPTLLSGDVMLVRPVTDFEGEGIYFIGVADQRFFRVAARLTGPDLHLISDNAIYAAERVTRAWFRENVLGIATFRFCAMDDVGRRMMRGS